MAARPGVSIVTAAYNAAATIGETIDSVLGQTSGDWEMIIVNDGSVDQTAAVIRDAYASRCQGLGGGAEQRRHGRSPQRRCCPGGGAILVLP